MRLVVSLFVGACSVAASGALASAQVADSAQPQRVTEREAIARFMANDPRVRALHARIDETRALQAERTLWPNPTATYSRESVSNAHDTFLLAHQELPISGRRRHLQIAGRIAVDAVQAETRFETVRLQAELRDAYTQLLAAQDREEALKSAIDALETLITVLRVREEGGEGSTYDRLRGERALVDLEADLALAAGARAQAQGHLAGFLGPRVLPEILVAADRLEAVSPRPGLEELIEQALASRGDYQSAELSIARFEAERVAATRLRVPTPTLTGGLKQSDAAGARNSGYQFSIDLTLPLFSRGQAAAALASAQKARAEAEAASRRARIEADVRAAYAVLAIHRERATRYRESAAAISEPLATIGRVGYEEGELTILELLDAERQALDARLRVIELAAAARRAATDLDRVTGQEFRP